MPDNSRLRLAVIVGSQHDDRIGPPPARWLAEQARRHASLEIEVIDLAEAALPAAPAGDEPLPSRVRAMAASLAAADAFVVVAEELHGEVPVSLKSAIAWFQDEWKAKPITFVSCGCPTAGRDASEQVRHMFTEVYAVALRHSINLPRDWREISGYSPPKTSTGPHASVKAVLEPLIWWARALREARSARPCEV
ncbi:NAD(P)H-dependent oxidoreductase [Actinomadura sp. 3N508]|uniref:NAD(P)H-dependent oxidoreductase n=1 Tax=Actinomadura sp. 3N508 TaxID=3375153 RepID=UPI0037AD023E